MRLSPNLLLAAYQCISTQESRYYLGGVNIECHPVNGAILVSTDGHKMIVVRDAAAKLFSDEAGIYKLSPEAIANLKKVKNKDNHYVYLRDGLCEIVEHNVHTDEEKRVSVAIYEIIDGTFPDWRRVVPKTDSAFTGSSTGFNGKYLSDFADIRFILDNDKARGVSLIPCISDGPVLIGFDENPAFGVLMPRRDYIKECFDVVSACTEAEPLKATG